MSDIQKVHFIAIGGSAMHNLALALHIQGLQVSGSDDEIYEPSRSRLAAQGLLPSEMGWFPERISPDLDAVIVGMHARKDNPEVQRARELEIPIYSYPEYIHQTCIDKQRVVIAGSHGKTTITAMVMHVLQHLGRRFDYLVGAQVEGFEVMVRISEEAPLMVIEGDEYPASPLAPKPKFLYYKPHITLISGVMWDHMNVYPSVNDYVRQFDKLADGSPKGGCLIYNDDDHIANMICAKEREDVLSIPYQAHPHVLKDGKVYLKTSEGDVPLQIFGEHNMQNLAGAKAVCLRLGINEPDFYQAIQSFKGAKNRLELLAENGQSAFYKDFAHAPSKVKATTKAMKKQYPQRSLVACVELHTFSSLNKEFLPQYKESLQAADTALVYFNPHTLAHKQLPALSKEEIAAAFQHKDLQVFDDSQALEAYLQQQNWQNKNLLMMSSGTFGQLDLSDLAKQMIS